MADKIGELNASIKARLQASSDAIRAGLTDKPAADADDAPKRAPAKRSTSSRSRK